MDSTVPRPSAVEAAAPSVGEPVVMTAEDRWKEVSSKLKAERTWTYTDFKDLR